jgi:acetyl esterase/lipase
MSANMTLNPLNTSADGVLWAPVPRAAESISIPASNTPSRTGSTPLPAPTKSVIEFPVDYRTNFWLGLAVFVYGWFGLIGFLVHWNLFFAANILFSISLCTFIRIPPPLGEIPLLTDELIMSVSRYHLVMVFICVVLLVVYKDHINSFVFLIFTLTGFTYCHRFRRAAAGYFARITKARLAARDPSYIRQNTGYKISLAKRAVPWIMDLHPFAFYLVPYPDKFVKHEVISIRDSHIKMDIWRLQPSIVISYQESLAQASVSPLQTDLPEAIPIHFGDIEAQMQGGVPAMLIDTPNPSAPAHQYHQSIPILVHVHAGAWKLCNSRAHAQVKLLFDLIGRGWIIISCNYRKDVWPNQLVDVRACLDYVVAHAADWGGSVDNIHLLGSSAGGHLISQIIGEMQKTRDPFRPASLSLVYAVVDPADSSGHCAYFPFKIPFLGVKSKQSMLAWFFEAAILRFKYSAEEIANWCPLNLICDEVNKILLAISLFETKSRRTDWSLTEEMFVPYFHWPRTYVVHGEIDSVVPCEQAVMFYTKLKELRALQQQYYERIFPVLLQRKAAQANVSTDSRPQDALESTDCDDLLVVPGGKHSFEFTDSTLVRPVNALIIDWLQH